MADRLDRMTRELVDLEKIRPMMVAEIRHDIARGTLYRSPRLTEAGWHAYRESLELAAAEGNETSLAVALQLERFWRSEEEIRTSRGRTYTRKVPNNANETLASDEFHRFYIRGVCRFALRPEAPPGEGVAICEAEREIAGTDAACLIGAHLDPAALLGDLRAQSDIALVLNVQSASGISICLEHG
jgi:hypothetical protein